MAHAVMFVHATLGSQILFDKVNITDHLCYITKLMVINGIASTNMIRTEIPWVPHYSFPLLDRIV